jgi:hypothetical protein
LAHADDCFQRKAKENIKPLKTLKSMYISMDELNYSAPFSSSQIEHKSVEVAMHATGTGLQNAETSGVASLHSAQHHAQALTTVLSGRKITVSF